VRSGPSPLGGTPPAPARRDRVVGFVLAIIGGLIGLIAALSGLCSLPYLPAQPSTSRANHSVAEAKLSVEFFGRPGYTKTSTDPEAFQLEAGLWVAIPPLVVALIGAIVGGRVGWWVGARLGRGNRVKTGSAGLPDQAVDYDDSVASPGAAQDCPPQHDLGTGGPK
jgi:hypothetical protein